MEASSNTTNPAPDRFPVVLLWHMHQPEYRLDGVYRLPWVYAHALKDYADMAAHLEAVPQARVVVNFSPVLLEQLDDYAMRLDRHLYNGAEIGDSLLDALVALPPRGPARARLARMCMRTDNTRQLARAGAYAALLAELADADEQALAGLADEVLTKLLIGWHLAWTGTSVFAADRRIAALSGQVRYGADERRTMLLAIAQLLRDLLGRYRALAACGRIELSMSPYQHPLLPLLLDFASAREARPDTPLPDGGPYPGGAQRAQWQLAQGRAVFERLLGRRPSGCWPSEAALSQAVLQLLDDFGCSWTASSQSVLQASSGAGAAAQPHARYSLRSGPLSVFFRDDELSDRIGFVYKDWNADAAVADLVSRLEQIAATPGRQLVLIALDGENPWAHYPANGADFVRGLYRALAAHPRLRMATLGELTVTETATALPPLRAGSWVDGNLLTWIGDAAKNRAWSWLLALKRRFDAAPAPTREAEHLLGICEGSDWFWWPDRALSGREQEFESLFREHLCALYRALGERAPEILGAAAAQAPAAAQSGAAMRSSRG